MVVTPDRLEPFRDRLRRLPARQGLAHRVIRLGIRVGRVLLGWRLEVTGMERLPCPPGGSAGAGCLIVAAPHRAWVEPFLLMDAWPTDAARPVWVGDARTVTSARWRRWLLPRWGVVPVGRAADPRVHAAAVATALGRGCAVVMFPEKGPPSAPDRVRTIAPGFAYLALASGAAVVPVVVGGTHVLVRDASFTIDVLDPMLPEELPSAEGRADPFGPAARAAAARMVDAYRDAVSPVLVESTRLAEQRRPRRERWRWLATLFR
jgi:1-acyl-sn-glycerol-3-phosphate acyltransferase